MTSNLTDGEQRLPEPESSGNGGADQERGAKAPTVESSVTYPRSAKTSITPEQAVQIMNDSANKLNRFFEVRAGMVSSNEDGRKLPAIILDCRLTWRDGRLEII